jgi:single-stranded-DNA-specific exonuclease
MPKRWKTTPVDESSARSLAGPTRLPLPIARVLAARGFHAKEDADRFLNPRLATLSDPFLLPDMQRAATRVWKAIDNSETITIFGDYDVDGVASCALLSCLLSDLGADVRPFIPDRLDEGYGLSKDALDRCLKEHGSTLVITVDCGTNAVETIARAQANGVDIIVTDHHEPAEKTASAFALVNPKTGTDPALANLAGVGVAFKFAHALLKSGREQGSSIARQIDLRDSLDLAALGTVADIVPLIGENRVIVRHGLAAIDATKREGLRALKAVSGIRGPVDTYHLGFQLGPRINAAGRIGQPMQALRLLTTDDPAEAREIADLLNRTNLQRRRLEKEMADEAFAEIEACFDPQKHYGLVVAKEGWHPGVVGIVASRVARRYNRPAIVMGIDKTGNARGSCRSIEAFDLLQGLRACAGHLLKFGGHKMAAGIEVAAGSIEPFTTAFNAAAANALEPIDLAPVQHIDSALSASELDRDFLHQLQRLHPFGQDNPEPVWALHDVQLAGRPRIVGEKHLKFSVASEGRTFDAIAFNHALDQLPDGDLDLAFVLKENTWQGRTTLQLQIKDIRRSNARSEIGPRI